MSVFILDHRPDSANCLRRPLWRHPLPAEAMMVAAHRALEFCFLRICVSASRLTALSTAYKLQGDRAAASRASSEALSIRLDVCHDIFRHASDSTHLRGSRGSRTSCIGQPRPLGVLLPRSSSGCGLDRCQRHASWPQPHLLRWNKPRCCTAVRATEPAIRTGSLTT